MCGVIHIDEVAQITVVVDECALRITGSLIPEDIDVTESALRPYIDFGAVSRRCSQGLSFARLKLCDP